MVKTRAISPSVKRVALAFCDSLAGPRSDEIKNLIANEDWDTYVNLRINPAEYSSSEDFWKDYSAAAFLKKFEALPTTFDRTSVAVENFYKAEAQCYRANERLSPFIFKAHEPADEALLPFIAEARKVVRELIGSTPPKLSQLDGRFGPGSTYGDRAQLSTVFDKMQSQPTLTLGALWHYVFNLAETRWSDAIRRRGDSGTIVRGNRFTTVPKDGKTDRGICIEPSVNIFYQLAYGQVIRDRLRQNTLGRVRLGDMQQLHKQVACAASSTGLHATIDLSQASDTVSKNLVRLLLPPAWYEALDSLRSPVTEMKVKGQVKTIVLEKFSSMGNGYTFELETLLFSAISVAACRLQGKSYELGRDVFVYGDDIIVPSDVSHGVLAVLRWCGFATNEAKTFVSGPFRESCGGDYFQGVDVRPFFLKDDLLSPNQIIVLANGLRRTCNGDPARWWRIMHVWMKVLDLLPNHVRRIRGPEALGDAVVHDIPENWRTKTRDGIRYIQALKSKPLNGVRFNVFDPDVQLAAVLYGAKPETGPRGNHEGLIIPRDPVLDYRIGWVPYS